MLHVPEDSFKRAKGHTVSVDVGKAADGRPLRYRHGGHPHTSPSLWLGEKRIAFWPEDRARTREAVHAVFCAWLASPDDLLGRAQARAAIDAA